MLTKIDYDKLSGTPQERFDSLLPYKKEEDLPPLPFVGLYDKGIPAGEKATAQRTHFICRHHFQLLSESNQEINEVRDVELLTSRLADREMQTGELIHLSDGYFYVAKLFVGGGAYTALLRDVEEKLPPKIVCRGTASRQGATERKNSVLNDLEFEMGSMGVRTIWPSLSGHLQQTKIVKIYGKSLGGAHAQQLAVLMESETDTQVEKLTTLGSVGAGGAINQRFIDVVLPKRETPFEIHVLRHSGTKNPGDVDLIPTVGGVHLGANAPKEMCKRKVTYLTSDGDSWVSPLANPSIRGFFSSLGTAHCRQLTLKRFSIHHLDDDFIDTHLKAGNQLEWYRRGLAHIAHWTPRLGCLTAW